MGQTREDPTKKKGKPPHSTPSPSLYVFMYGSYKHSGSFLCAQKIRALIWKPKIHFVCSQSYCFTYYKKHFKEFQVFLASCPCVRKFTQNITADAGFLGDKATVFSGMIQGTSRVFRSSGPYITWNQRHSYIRSWNDNNYRDINND